MSKPDYSGEPWERAVRALRTPDPSLRGVANTVRESMADVIVDLAQAVANLEQRQRDTDWLQAAAFQILQDHGIKPSSADLIAAYKKSQDGP